MFDPQSTPISQRGSFLLAQLGAHASRLWADRIAPLGLEPRHFALLGEVVENEGQTQQQLAERLGVHRNLMVGLIDDLQSRGFVERRPRRDDRRANSIVATADARELMAAAEVESVELERELLGTLSRESYTELLGTLTALVEGANLLPGVHPAMSNAPATRDNDLMSGDGGN